MNKCFYLSLWAILFLLGFYPYSLKAQVKISTAPGVPNAGAMLEVESSNRGFLLPRIYLTDIYMWLNGGAPTEGTMIYSTNTSGDGSLSGLFIWQNNVWTKFGGYQKIVASRIRVAQNAPQFLPGGQNTILLWHYITDKLQPLGDASMWIDTDKTKIFIRRAGLYCMSVSCRVDNSLVGEERYLALQKNGLQFCGDGFRTIGNSGQTNSITLNATAIIYCQPNDEITCVYYSNNNADTSPDLGTTQFSVSQLSVTQL